MNDLATPEMDTILSELRPKIRSIFPPEEFDVVITGSSRVFLEGTKYLVGNLAYSLLLVILLISMFRPIYISAIMPVFKYQLYHNTPILILLIWSNEGEFHIMKKLLASYSVMGPQNKLLICCWTNAASQM